MNSTEANKNIAMKFVSAWNSRDFDLLDEIFHPSMTWHTAITPPGVNEVSPLQSSLLKNSELTWKKAINNKQETIDIFKLTLGWFEKFDITISSLTAEADIVAVEAQGCAIHPGNGRNYNNIYCYIMKIADGKIILFREYQNTLLAFDVMVD